MAASSEKPQGKKKARDPPKFNKSSKKPFKPNKDRNDTARSEAVALQLEDDVPDFPRGSNFSSFCFSIMCFYIELYWQLTGSKLLIFYFFELKVEEVL